jgi:hypothetical protein
LLTLINIQKLSDFAGSALTEQPVAVGALTPVLVSEQRAETTLGILLVQASIYVNVADTIQMEVVAPFFIDQKTARRVQHSDGADV